MLVNRATDGCRVIGTVSIAIPMNSSLVPKSAVELFLKLCTNPKSWNTSFVIIASSDAIAIEELWPRYSSM